MYHYFAFGLHIHSDFKLPELLAGNPEKVADVTIQAGPVQEQARALEGGSLAGGESWLTLQVKDTGQLHMTEGTRITYETVPQGNPNTLRLFLLGAGLGGILHQRKTIVLHGNCISTDGQTGQIYVGDSGAGKSTMAAWHYHSGAKILADDLCAVVWDQQGDPWVLPSYPQIKLWRESLRLLGMNPTQFSPLHNREDKFAIPIHERFWATPVRLTHVYDLKPEHTEERPYSGAEKFNTLLRNTYRYVFLSRMGMTQVYFAELMKLVDKVSVSQATRKQIEV